MANRMRIAAVSEICEEVYEPSGVRRLGGISVNFARAAERAGARAVVYSALGTDDAAARLETQMRAQGLSTERIRSIEGRTASQRIKLQNGERVFCGYDAGVLETYRPSDDELAELRGFDAVAMPISQETLPLANRCLEALPVGRCVADFSVDSPVNQATEAADWIAPFPALAIAFVGGVPEFLPAIEKLSSRYFGLIVLTAGRHGAWAVEHGTAIHQPSLAANVVNTTGCGDAFAGAFTVSWFTHRSAQDALRAGAEAAKQIAEAAFP